MSKSYITVFGLDNLGYSDKFGVIVRGQEYTIDEADFTDQLFTLTRPEPLELPEPAQVEPEPKQGGNE